MSASEYLAWEAAQLERHEFFDGEVFAVAGGTLRHNALTAAVTMELGIAFRGGKCRVLSTDQRIVARDRKHYVTQTRAWCATLSNCSPAPLMSS